MKRWQRERQEFRDFLGQITFAIIYCTLLVTAGAILYNAWS